MFSGIAGLRAHQQKMDVIANNIANVNTYGYKSGRVTFKESIYQTTSSSSEGNDVFGGSNPSQVGYGSEVGTIDLMFSSGAYAPTDSSMDCMIDGEGFFYRRE
jgi:flagellar hook protein FlgE